MAGEKTRDERLQEAIEKYQADNEKLGIKPPNPVDFDFYIKAEKYLTSLSDKVYFALLINAAVSNSLDKEKAVNWAKKLFNDNKESANKGELFPDLIDNSIILPLALKFIHNISPEMAQKYIDLNPVIYLEAKIFFSPEDKNLYRDPTKKDLTIAIGKLPKDKLKLEHLDVLEDPKLYNSVLNILASNPVSAASIIKRELELKISGKPYDNEAVQLAFKIIPQDYIRSYMLEHIDDREIKKSYSLLLARNKFYCREILDLEIQKKEKGKEFDSELVQLALETRTGFKKDFQSPAVAGSIFLDLRGFEKYGSKIYSPEEVKKLMINLAKADPAIGFSFASIEYPENKNAIDIYFAALPRARELLTEPHNAALVINLLNKLEPSQYAGQTHLLIPQRDIFKALDGANSGQLYDLITQQQTSTGFNYTQGTYNEISKRLYETLAKENKSFSDLMRESPERAQKLRDFIKTADSFKRMDDLVSHLNREDHHRIVEMLFTKQEGFGHDISTLSSFIKNLPKNSPAIPYIEATIIERALNRDDFEKADMGLLGRWLANQDVHKISTDNQGFFNRVKNDPSFEVKDLAAIKSGKLLDVAGRNFQLHAFYNDKDGIDTFKSFSNSLRADGFQVKKQDDFLIFSKESNGRRVEIVVSPPEKDGATIPQIVDYIKSKNGVMSVLSGRGHAHHMEKAVELITPDTKIVALGGCWGHNYASAVLEKSPDAHILATTGVGRMAINNFNTKWINDQILSGRDMNWVSLEKEWERLKKDKTLAKDIEQYISPNQNIFLMYEKKRLELYEEIERRSKGEEASPTSQFNDAFMQSVRGTASAPLPTQKTSKLDLENAPVFLA